MPSPMPSAPTCCGELLGRRQHVGQGIGLVRDRVDVEALRARNMAGEEFGLRIALVVREIVRAVEDDHVRIVRAAPRAIRSTPASGWRVFLQALDAPYCFAHHLVRRPVSTFRDDARSGERNPHAAVLLALFLDLRHAHRADFAGAAHMRAAAGLQVDSRRSRSAARGRCRSAASPTWFSPGPDWLRARRR